MPTLNFNYNGEALVMNQITEGNNSSEYLLRTNLVEYRLKIRHSKEKAQAGLTALDRHNVELTRRVYPTAEKPQGVTEVAYIVVRSDPDSDGEAAERLTESLLVLTNGYREKLIGWLTSW